MQLHQRLNISRRSYVTEYSAQCVLTIRGPHQRPIWCLRGKPAAGRLKLIAQSSGVPAANDSDDCDPRRDKGLAGLEAEWTAGVPHDEACNELGHIPEETPLLNAIEICKEKEGYSRIEASNSENCESRPKLAGVTASSQVLVHTIDPQELNRCEIFDVFQDSQLDVQAASHFFSQLAMHDSWGSPLATDDLIHAARIADITGFALPPIIAAQLQQLVQASGPVAASATAGPLLAVFDQDLPMLLDFLTGLEIKASLFWMDYALKAWLQGGGKHTRTAVTVSNVRAVMIALETIYSAEVDPWIEAAALSHPTVPWPAFHDIADGVRMRAPHPRYDDAWTLSSTFGDAATTAAKGPASGMEVSYTSVPSDTNISVHQSCEASYLRAWLDACIATLLADDGDGGGPLSLPYQRDDLYAMLPYLATAPTAAMMERLYGAAPPSHSSSADGNADSYGQGTIASSPEHIAALVWLCAKSGAKLPPALLQRELRALETAVLRLGSWGPSSYRSSWRHPDANNPNPTKHEKDPAGGVDASSAAARAALAAAFALPSAPGSGAISSSLPTPPATSRSTSLISSSSPPLPSLPPSINPRTSPPTPTPRLTPRGAYLCFWAFHHYHHLFSPHAASALHLGTTLLTATLPLSPAARVLSPRQRCRVLRSLLLCFEASLPRILASYDVSPHLSGLETLGTNELLPLLQDIAVTTRLNRNRRHQSQLRSAASSAGDANGSGDAAPSSQVDLQLRHLAVYILQMPGWTERLAGASITAVTASLSNVLEILSVGSGLGVGGSSGGEAVRAGMTAPLGATSGGSGGSVPSTQAVLSDWISSVLQVIENGVKSVTGDWGEPAGARPSALSHPQSLPRQQQAIGYDYYNTRDDVVSSASQYAQLVHKQGYLAVTSAALPTVKPGDLPSVPGRNQSAQSLLRPSSLSSSSPPSLTAEALIAVLTALHDTAAALNTSTQPELQRTLLWALQRLGSRAGRWLPQPAAFNRVPEMLVRLDALGWVDVPVEWADAVVQHSDQERCWFQHLSWAEALRAVLESRHLVQIARAQVLRKHGASSLTLPLPSQTTPEIEVAAGGDANDNVTMTSPSLDSLITANSVEVNASGVAIGETSSPSKAKAFLKSAVRLRNHLLNLLAARASIGGTTELRQLALTWQVYDLPYDREALAVVLDVVGRAWKGAHGKDGRGSGCAPMLKDALMRLRHVCERAEVSEADMEGLFREYGG